MRVLQVCAEIFPLLKTGGLADVCGALPAALLKRGCDVRVLVPAFPAMLRGLPSAQPVAGANGLPDGTRLLRGMLSGQGVPIYLIDAPLLYGLEGNPYVDGAGQAHADNHRRFALLGRIGALLADGLDPSWSAEVVHGHDWHAGLVPAYLRAAELRSGRRRAGSVHTVHNLAFQGTFPLDVLGELGLPADFYQTHGLEFHGQVSFMKAGLHYADHITTVSPTYAREIQGEEQGCGLDGVLRERSGELSGILNAVDDAVWNPASDVLIPAHYDGRKLAGKQRCRRALQNSFGLGPQTDRPLFGVVSRLTDQKGLNLILEGLPQLLERGGQLVVLGTGDPALVSALLQAAKTHPGAVAVKVDYDETLAHCIIAGVDVMMVPSRFEPCGLTQLYGLKYGSLPLVRRVGGLADTVVDSSLENLDDGTATGFVFERFAVDDYTAALRRAFVLFKRKSVWQAVQRRAMAQAFDWDTAAAQYVAQYERVLS